MKHDFWPQFRQYINGKEVGHRFRRPDFLLFANLHYTPHGTVDTNRNLLVRAGFLKIVARGTYEVINKIPNGTTTTELHELAYGDKLMYLEKVVKRKEREKIAAAREALLLELKTKNAAIILEARAKSCLDCNLPLPDYVKVFSYTQPQDKYQGISAFMSAPTEKLLAELTKCDLICLNCHMIRLHNDKHSVYEK
jgi:hypothetical protein